MNQISTGMFLMMIAAFAASACAFAAVCLLARDIVVRRNELWKRRLGQLGLSEEINTVLAKRQSGSSLDQWFTRLVESTGSSLSTSTALLLVCAAGLIGGGFPLVFGGSTLLAGFGMLTGSSIPLLWWMARRSWRMSRMQRQLPEALEIVADALRGGQSMQQAAELVQQELSGPLGKEFGICARQLQLGHSAVNVLDRMARRVPLPELRVFATAGLVHQQTGGNLPALTSRLAGAAQDRQGLLDHLRAVSAGSRLSAIGLVAGSLLGVVLLGWIQPDYQRVLLNHEFGITLIAMAVVLQCLGAFWVWRILRVSY